jgi:transcriptional regulator with XRE-family HTH domain
MRSIDPTRDDAGVRLRTLRLRRGLTQVAPADLACVSPAFVSMVETGQRPLRSADHILALSDVLKVSPYYLADGREDASAARRAAGTAPFPARCDHITLARHRQLAQRVIQARPSGGPHDGRVQHLEWRPAVDGILGRRSEHDLSHLRRKRAARLSHQYSLGPLLLHPLFEIFIASGVVSCCGRAAAGLVSEPHDA